MQANDVRVLKSAAIPTAAVGVVAALLALLAAGAEGVLGAVIGTLLVGLFFTISIVVVSFAGRVSPQLMMLAAMGSYLVKVLVIIGALNAFSDATAWNTTAFAWSVVACTIVWSAFEVRAFMKTKVLYVDPQAKVPGQGD